MNFKKCEKELNKAGYAISGDFVINSRGDVVGQMDPYGEFHSSEEAVIEAIRKAMSAPAPVKKTKATKKRARDEDGHFKADDPSTPDVNEAWEE